MKIVKGKMIWRQKAEGKEFPAAQGRLLISNIAISFTFHVCRFTTTDCRLPIHEKERRGVTSPVTPCCNNFSRCVGSDRGLMHFPVLGFSTAYKYVRKWFTANDCIQLRIFTPGAPVAIRIYYQQCSCASYWRWMETSLLNKELNTISQQTKIAVPFLLLRPMCVNCRFMRVKVSISVVKC